MNILLHGFPEGSYGWRHQLAALGPDTVAPDQRGYGSGASPRIGDYRIDLLANDVLESMDRAGVSQANLAGHDWGAMVAWWVAMHHPDRVRRLAILNVPHPAVMSAYLKSDPAQMLRSWYAGFFQIPVLPEALLRARDFAMLRRSMQQPSRPGTFSDEDFARYKVLWSAPGALTGMLNWYRAAARYAPDKRRVETRVRVPVRILWGMRDRFLASSMAEASARWCDHAEVIPFPEGSHWLQNEEPTRVTEILRDWFR